MKGHSLVDMEPARRVGERRATLRFAEVSEKSSSTSSLAHSEGKGGKFSGDESTCWRRNCFSH